jgi:uncharacterized membrane protein YecN with MAPEG domain
MLPVSLSFAAALALFNLFLAYRIVKVRMHGKVLIGHGENPLLETRMRAQANFIEYSPFVLALVFLIELAGGRPAYLEGIAVLYLLGRAAHAFGLDARTPNAGRGIGILVTWLVMLGLAIWALVLATHAPAAHETML